MQQDDTKRQASGDAAGGLSRASSQGNKDIFGDILTDKRKQKIQVGDKAGGSSFDFMEQIARMSKSAQGRSSSTSGGLLGLSLLNTEASLIDVKADGLLTGTDRLIEEARALVQKHQYAEALQRLDQALVAAPEHLEGLYLRALCLCRVGKPEDGLVIVSNLLDRNLPPSLKRRVEALRAEATPQFVQKMFEELLLLLQKSGPAKAAIRMQAAIRLAPSAAMLYFLCAGAHMMANELDDAITVTEKGLVHCSEGEKGRLIGLQAEIDARRLRLALQPAITHFKHAAFSRARQALVGLPPRFRSQPLYVFFSRHLEKLCGCVAPRSGEPYPSADGTASEKENLYALLIQDEIRTARQCMKEDRFDEAVTTLKTAIFYTPDYPFAYYLCGAALFNGFGAALTKGVKPDLDAAIAQLEEALLYAEFGATDPEITDGAESVSIVTEMLVQIKQIREINREMGEINKATSEFIAIMETLKGGLSDAGQFTALYNRLQQLKQQLPGIGAKLTTSHAKQEFQLLKEAVESNFSQLDNMKEDIAISARIKGFYEEFDKLMSDIKNGGGISSRYQLDTYKSMFHDLQGRVLALRKTARDSSAKKALDNLVEVLNKIVAQFNSH